MNIIDSTDAKCTSNEEIGSGTNCCMDCGRPLRNTATDRKHCSRCLAYDALFQSVLFGRDCWHRVPDVELNHGEYFDITPLVADRDSEL